MRRALLLSSLLWAGGCGSTPPTPSVDMAEGETDAATAPDAAAAPADFAEPPMDLAAPPDLLPSPDLATNPAGPWPVADLTRYSGSSGLGGPIREAAVDDGQNIWAISADTLYVLQPGMSHFAKFTAADGLHIGSFVDASGNPNVTWLTALAGGRPGEAFVGYNGFDPIGNPFLDTDAQKRLGQADRVELGSDGKISVTRYFFPCDYSPGSGCWEDRSVRRMLYAHSGPAVGHLFLGFQHGVSHEYNDSIGDHVHPEVFFRNQYGGATLMSGEYYGLALNADGDLWMAGAFGVGLFPFNPVPHFNWVDGHYKYAFTLYTDNHQLETFKGYREDERGVGVSPDGTVWFASSKYGLSSWNPITSHGGYTQVKHWSAPGLPGGGLMDLQADPDGTIWLVTDGGQLLRFDPTKPEAVVWPGVDGALRIDLDATVTPRALYVAMDGGIAVIRGR